MTRNEAIKDSISHWERMIGYGEKINLEHVTKVNCSKTWLEWLKNAKVMLNQLKEIPLDEDILKDPRDNKCKSCGGEMDKCNHTEEKFKVGDVWGTNYNAFKIVSFLGTCRNKILYKDKTGDKVGDHCGMFKNLKLIWRDK